MKKISLITKLFCMSFLLGIILISTATNSAKAASNEIDYSTDPRENPNLVEGVDYDIETIEFDNITELPSNEITKEVDIKNPQEHTVSPAMVLMPGPLWDTRNITYIGTTIGSTSVWDTEGKPGMTISTAFNKSVTSTVSATFGASYSDLSANLSFTIGKSYGVTSTGSYVVPKTYNGKTVSKVVLKAYPKYKKYSMEVYKRNDIYFRYDYKGTANAYYPTGISFDYIHYYK